VPAYTDRVLVAGGAEVSEYGAVFDLLSSDHRPVFASLEFACDPDAAPEPGVSKLGSQKSEVCAVS